VVWREVQERYAGPRQGEVGRARASTLSSNPRLYEREPHPVELILKVVTILELGKAVFVMAFRQEIADAAIFQLLAVHVADVQAEAFVTAIIATYPIIFSTCPPDELRSFIEWIGHDLIFEWF
jgi:hypothetical protein